ncbi:flagellar hook-basal body complex protein FliE [Xanthomonas sp. XNM01]|uniref:flagellar hook-basal body complex protein FliE n=1 Tax=Xanthomonas sp. XNM01 TaxID=2769289 RepID=UPI0017840894|nr:flagellar hook-basal body complex protein FliE [Xanthomonas sp. XNM01]MBD9370924.1 flagellar hook-basal body complex protein FliE [Xanthomonas sp. XNM01]
MSVLPTLPPMPSLESLLPGELARPAANPRENGTADFGGLFTRALNGVDAQAHAASRQVEAVETGASDDLIGAMLASQQAGLSFSMLVQVRNKVMSAFDDVMKMTV